jgi:hypothetical protein
MHCLVTFCPTSAAKRFFVAESSKWQLDTIKTTQTLSSFSSGSRRLTREPEGWLSR